MDYASIILDRADGLSLYLQLTEALAFAVARGELALGERLPSERELAGLLGVSRTTVVAAYRELEARGLVRSHVGRGTFVVGGAGADDEGTSFAWRGKLASGAGRLSDPALRALVEEASPGTVSFGPGVAALDRFPVNAFRRLTDRVLRRGAEVSLGLLPTEGHPALREAIAARCGAAGSEEVLVVSGAQQGLDLVTRCLVDPGDAVVMDRPGYLGAVQTFLSAGADVVGWDFERADTGELGDLLLRHRPKLIYTNPTFQNPTGLTLPLAKRREVLRLARRHRVPVVEDEPYRELRFAGSAPPPPTLRDLDEGGLVVHLGTFSKTLAAGLRLGWVLAPEAVVEQLALVKARSDLFGNAPSQLVVAEMLATDLFDAHVSSLREEHGRRYRALVRSLEHRLAPGTLSWRAVEGGLYLWCRLSAPGLDSSHLRTEAAHAGVSFVAGKPFYADGGGERRIRLCYAGLPPADIERGVARLAGLFEGEVGEPSPRVSASRPLV
jgi:DNA-binding transcriptional MocR family regulator